MDGILKYDSQTGAINFGRHMHTPREAIFIPDPKSDKEDGGILFSVVLNGVVGENSCWMRRLWRRLGGQM